MSADQLAKLIWEAMSQAADQAAPYKAVWSQTVPEADTMELAAALLDHHSEAVLAAGEAEPLLLCMLSDTDMGAVERAELAKLLEWVQAQPEVA
jgi:hypothetical protein